MTPCISWVYRELGAGAAHVPERQRGLPSGALAAAW